MNCGATRTSKRTDLTRAATAKLFLSWLTGKASQAELATTQDISTRTLQRWFAPFWAYRPRPVPDGVIHPVIGIDGIWLTRTRICLIASTPDGTVLDWVWAQSENSHSWGDLLSGLPAPDVVVIDGGSGIRKALRLHWPETRVQRCLFHIQAAVRRHTTLNPRLEAGKELKALATTLGRISTRGEATEWLRQYNQWHQHYKEFLAERTWFNNRKWEFTHRRLRTARRHIDDVIRAGHLFTYLEPELENLQIPKTTSWHEGQINAGLRTMLRDHRGMHLKHRVRAVDWWLYQHTARPEPIEHIIKHKPRKPTPAPTEQELWEQTGRPVTYDTNPVFTEFHTSGTYH